MTEQNRRYVMKEIGRLLSEIWRIKGAGGAGVRADLSINYREPEL